MESPIPEKIARWLIPLYTVMSGGGLILLSELGASSKVISIVGLLTLLLGSYLGRATPSGPLFPGKKSGAGIIVLVLAFSSLSSCAHLTPPPADRIVDCGKKALRDAIPGVIIQVDEVLTNGGIDWRQSLDSLVIAGGDAVLCAIRVAIENLRDDLAIMSAADVVDDRYGASIVESLERGVSYLEEREERVIYNGGQQ